MDSIIDFCTTDSMIKEFYHEYVDNANFPSKVEAIRILNFFGMMSIQCRKYEMKDIADIYDKRLHAYCYILRLSGYKRGKKLASITESGIESIFQKAFYSLGGDAK